MKQNFKLTLYRKVSAVSPPVARLLFPRVARYVAFVDSWGTIDSENQTYVPNLEYWFKAIQTFENRYVSDKTWEDLDFDQIFLRIDSCVTSLGKQSLYNTLRTYRPEETLKSRFTDIGTLMAQTKFREAIQMSLAKLEHEPSWNLIALLHGETPPVPHSKLIILQSSLTVIVLLACFFSPTFIPVAVAMAAINFYVSIRMADRVSRFMSGYSQLSSLLFCAVSLPKADTPASIKVLDNLPYNKSTLYWLAQRLRFFAVDRVGGAGVLNLFFHWMNIVALLDPLLYVRGTRIVGSNKTLLVDVLETISTVDEMISIANYLVASEQICHPEMVEGNGIAFDKAYHPLLKNPVKNSATIDKQSLLIAGSNMAGKTTFIRTIGVNVILAQTVWFAHADGVRLGSFEVYTAIKRDDAILRGESYYFTELKLILNMIEKSSLDGPFLFLIDEIYRGTNTVERIAASTSVLEILSERQTVMVTTHDVELLDRLEGRYELLHFEETGNPDEPFDFLVRPGRPLGRNAIKLLDRIGYPQKIVERALEIVSELESKSGKQNW